MDPRYLSLAQVEVELGLDREDVDDLIGEGALVVFTIAGRQRVDRRSLDALVHRLVFQAASGAPGAAGQRRHAATTRLRPAAPEPATPQAGAGATVGRHLQSVLGHLTDHQRRILHLVGDGMSNAEVAHALSIEVSTVKSHVSRLLQRFALRDREQLIAHLWRSGFML